MTGDTQETEQMGQLLRVTLDLPASFRATFEGLDFIVTVQHAPGGKVLVCADVEGEAVGVQVTLDAFAGQVRHIVEGAVWGEVVRYHASLVANVA